MSVTEICENGIYLSFRFCSYLSNGPLWWLSLFQPRPGHEVVGGSPNPRDFRRDVRHSSRPRQETRKINRQVQGYSRLHCQPTFGKFHDSFVFRSVVWGRIGIRGANWHSTGPSRKRRYVSMAVSFRSPCPTSLRTTLLNFIMNFFLREMSIVPSTILRCPTWLRRCACWSAETRLPATLIWR